MENKVDFEAHVKNSNNSISNEEQFRTMHLALYVGLMSLWIKNKFKETFALNIEELMMLSRVGSKHSALLLLHDLHDKKYIVYKAGKTKSKVTINRFDLK